MYPVWGIEYNLIATVLTTRMVEAMAPVMRPDTRDIQDICASEHMPGVFFTPITPLARNMTNNRKNTAAETISPRPIIAVRSLNRLRLMSSCFSSEISDIVTRVNTRSAARIIAAIRQHLIPASTPME